MTTEIVDPASLRLHPLLQKMPAPESELLTSIANDLVDRGQDYPLLVDEKNRVVDGRKRLSAILQLELPEVEIARCASADAATIIVQSLLQRAHYSKSALAYLAFPFFEQMVVEARQRMVSRRFGSAQNALPAKTAEEIARAASVSRRLFFQAKEIHSLFARHPEAKEAIEPQILNGDLCLGYAINGVAGLLATQQGKNQGQAGADQLDLFQRGIASLRVRFSRWEQLAPKYRKLVANEFAQAIADAPEEVQQSVRATLLARKAAAR